MDTDDRAILEASRMVNPVLRVVRAREGATWTSVHVERGDALPRFRYSEYPHETFSYFGIRALLEPEDRAWLRAAKLGDVLRSGFMDTVTITRIR